ncbi:FAD-dependent oxidoreductase [Hymenobacter sediminis]|uniref:flavin-containing monooxygenase n=1 Tax=Hymenobacter sediminis TaxID=2218621 RepID=UPI000DA65A5A|nr:NAD(P)/FAD-dependent oxidoreductase [Hymenobacter sediminis]RPD49669.1 FAD-dependent oxidoreductase [Hymenobacter sediminis]
MISSDAFSPTPCQAVQTVVVGAGQAGLAAAYYLRQAGAPFVVLESRQGIGDVWANRYDSLRLFSPAWASNLPGFPWPGPPTRYPTKAEAAAYLSQYAAHFKFPVETGQQVVSVQPVSGGFRVLAATGRCWQAENVVVCTGPFTAPRVPPFSQRLPAAVQQLHSSAYLRPTQIQGPGPVGVVGSGNSALQIATDLASSGRSVYLAFDEKTPAMPNNTAMWALLLGTHIMQASRTSWVGRLMRRRPEPVVSADLRRVRQLPNVHLIGRAQKATAAATLIGQRSATPPLEAIIWATGFGPDYEWLQVPGALGPDGQPLHERGLSPVQGVAFLGLPWLHSRRSALMGGAGPDAEYVIARLLKKT